MLTTNLYDPPAAIRAPSAGDDLLKRRVEEFNSAVDEFRARWRELHEQERDHDARLRAGKGDPSRDLDPDQGESLKAVYRQQEELITRCIGAHRDRVHVLADCLTALRVAFKEAEAELAEAVENVTSDLSDQGWTAGCLDGQALSHSRSLRGFAGAMRQSARERLFETVVVRSHPDVSGPRDRVHALTQRDRSLTGVGQLGRADQEASLSAAFGSPGSGPRRRRDHHHLRHAMDGCETADELSYELVVGTDGVYWTAEEEQEVLSGFDNGWIG